MKNQRFVAECSLFITSIVLALFINAIDLPSFMKKSAWGGIVICLVIALLLIWWKLRLERTEKEKQTHIIPNFRAEPISKGQQKPIDFISSSPGGSVNRQVRKITLIKENRVKNVRNFLVPQTIKAGSTLAIIVQLLIIVLSSSLLYFLPGPHDPDALVRAYCSALQRQAYEESSSYTDAGLFWNKQEFISQAQAVDKILGKVLSCVPSPSRTIQVTATGYKILSIDETTSSTVRITRVHSSPYTISVIMYLKVGLYLKITSINSPHALEECCVT